jgi:hypothetical protein
VRTPIDARLRDEAARFAFRFACDDCVHFAAHANPTRARCSLGYPAEPRRDALGPLATSFTTCKEFELA